MTVLGYIVLTVCVAWLVTVAALSVREVWRDSVRARRERGRGLGRKRLP